MHLIHTFLSNVLKTLQCCFCSLFVIAVVLLPPKERFLASFHTTLAKQKNKIEIKIMLFFLFLNNTIQKRVMMYLGSTIKYLQTLKLLCKML